MKRHDARTSMSPHALDSKPVQDGLLRLRFDCGGLYEARRKRATG